MKIRLIIATLTALLLPALSFMTVAQDDGARFSVSGTVVDDGGEPLSGAFVMVVGTSNGTTTDAKGQFTINNVSAGDVLEVQFLGFANSRVNAAKGKNVTVAMFPDSNLTLNEAVTIAYGSVRRQDLTGSVTNVKMSASRTRLSFRLTRPFRDASRERTSCQLPANRERRLLSASEGRVRLSPPTSRLSLSTV